MRQIKKYRLRPVDPEDYLQRHNESYPMSVWSYRSGFRSKITFISRNYYWDKYREIDKNHHPTQVYSGVRYLFHAAFDLFSKSSIQHFSLSAFRVLFLLNPQLTIIDEALHAYPVEKRGCYLPEEKVLKFFKVFSKENCRTECLANKTLSVCGCVQFFMVRKISTRICGIQDMKCYQKVEKDLSSSNPCNCYLECGEVIYKVDPKRMEFVA
jgi:hypothetical protein